MDLRSAQVTIIKDYIRERIADNKGRYDKAPEIVKPMYQTSMMELQNVLAGIEHAESLNPEVILFEGKQPE